MSTLAQRLKIAREQAGISQGQVAKLIGFHRPTISEIEAGRRKVSTDELRLFSEIYDVSIEWLMEENNTNDIDERIQLAARGLADLKEEDLEKVLKLLSSIRSKEGK